MPQTILIGRHNPNAARIAGISIAGGRRSCGCQDGTLKALPCGRCRFGWARKRRDRARVDLLVDRHRRTETSSRRCRCRRLVADRRHEPRGPCERVGRPSPPGDARKVADLLSAYNGRRSKLEAPGVLGLSPRLSHGLDYATLGAGGPAGASASDHLGRRAERLASACRPARSPPPIRGRTTSAEHERCARTLPPQPGERLLIARHLDRRLDGEQSEQCVNLMTGFRPHDVS
jgi:hypothetical protein